MIYFPDKHPGEVIDYGMDWSQVLADLGDVTVTASAWEVESGTLVLSGSAFTAKNTAIRVGGGAEGVENYLRNTVTTSDGQTLIERAFLKTRS